MDDLVIPAQAINPAGSLAPPAVDNTDGSLLFAVDKTVTFSFQLPHSWKVETDVSFHIHWAKTTSAAGTVNWQIKYKWGNIGEVMPGYSALTSGVESVANANTAELQALMSFQLLQV